MGSMIDHNQEHGQEENGDDIADDNFAMEIVQFWNYDIHKKSDDEEDAADHSTDGIQHSQLHGQFIHTCSISATFSIYKKVSFLFEHYTNIIFALTSRKTFEHHLLQLTLYQCVINTVLGSYLQTVI